MRNFIFFLRQAKLYRLSFVWCEGAKTFYAMPAPRECDEVILNFSQNGN